MITTSLKLTDIDMPTMVQIQAGIVHSVAVSDLNEVIVKHLTSLLSTLYAARGCRLVVICRATSDQGMHS